LVDLLLLGGDVVVGVLHVDGEALVLQALLDVVPVGDPALVGLGRHGDADGLVLGGGVGVGAAGAGAGPAAGREAERCRGGGAAQDEASAVVHGSLLVEVSARSPHRERDTACGTSAPSGTFAVGTGRSSAWTSGRQRPRVRFVRCPPWHRSPG